MSAMLRHFTRMNTPMFYGYKVGEDPQELVKEIEKSVNVVGVTSRERKS